MSTYPTPQDAARRAIQLLGGPSRAARLLKVKGQRHQTVQSWLRTRVPAEYCPDIEAETRERGATVLCEQIRPDVPWGRIRGHVVANGQADGATGTGQLDDQQGGEAMPDASEAGAAAELAA